MIDIEMTVVITLPACKHREQVKREIGEDENGNGECEMCVGRRRLR
jgi:hypothetical protein